MSNHKNKHESPRAAIIAEQNMILLSQVGSGLHGVTVTGHDDRDEMGVCIPGPEDVIGLGTIPTMKNGFQVGWERFDMYQYRTQPEGARSGPGDLDHVVYSLAKWTKLAAHGNPTVLLLLWAPESELVLNTPWGEQLQASTDMFLSKSAGYRFLGYLQSQEEQMLGLRSKHTNRPELIDIYGFDTKFAYHAIRLGIQGMELMTTGKVTLPMPEPERAWLTDLRLGKYSKDVALARIRELKSDLGQLVDKVDLPQKVDQTRLNVWLQRMHMTWWET